jgi:hypothetical protein
MASRDPPKQTPSIYNTAKKCFLGVAPMLAKGLPLPVLTNDLNIVITPIPTGGWAIESLEIENSVERLRETLSKQSEWKKARTMSADKEEVFIILYHSDVFSSDEEAVRFALTKRSEMVQLEYIEGELGDG